LKTSRRPGAHNTHDRRYFTKGKSPMMKIISLIIASALALCLAALSAAYWHIELADQPAWQSTLAIAGSVCVSLMTFVAALHIRSHGAVLILAVAIFFAADTYQNTQGWQTLNGISSSDELKAANARLTEAKDKLVNLPTPDANGAIRKKETYEITRASLTADIELFQADVTRLATPATPPLYVAIAMGFIQIALSIFFAAMGKREDGAEPIAPAIEETPSEEGHGRNVLVFSHRAKPMNEKDLAAWNAISSQA